MRLLIAKIILGYAIFGFIFAITILGMCLCGYEVSPKLLMASLIINGSALVFNLLNMSIPYE